MVRIDDAIDFLIEEKGEWITYQGQEKKVLIVDVSNSPEYYQDKLIHTTFKIETGDSIRYQDQQWLITSQVDKGRRAYQGRMRRTNYKIKMVVDGELCEFETIIELISFGVTSSTIMTMLDGKIKVTLPATTISERITENQRFIIMGRAWKVIGVDRTRLGLLELHVDKDAINPNTDDVANGIADKTQIATWDIVIDAFKPQLLVGESCTYNAKVLKDGQEVTNRRVLWKTNNEKVVSVKDSTLTAHEIGEAQLLLHLEGNESIQKIFEVQVVEELEPTEPVATYKMWCMYVGEGIKYYDFFDILLGETAQYGVEKYWDGKLAEVNDTYTFTVDAGGIPADRYTFRVLSGDLCEIVSLKGDVGRKLKLKAMSNQTNHTLEELIQLWD